MLIAALDDDDVQNVQAAARSLGMRAETSAAPALEAIAAGDGRGGRENPARLEAIYALGRIGQSSSVPVLEQLARRRMFVGGGRAQELRAAAESALAKIKAKGND